MSFSVVGGAILVLSTAVIAAADAAYSTVRAVDSTLHARIRTRVGTVAIVVDRPTWAAGVVVVAWAVLLRLVIIVVGSIAVASVAAAAVHSGSSSPYTYSPPLITRRLGLRLGRALCTVLYRVLTVSTVGSLYLLLLDLITPLLWWRSCGLSPAVTSLSAPARARSCTARDLWVDLGSADVFKGPVPLPIVYVLRGYTERIICLLHLRLWYPFLMQMILLLLVLV
jgi:hypothetical protein